MFRITDFIEFESNRAVCPSCEQQGKGRKKNLSLLESGAYKCHRGCSVEDIRNACKNPKPEENLPLPSAETKTVPKATTLSPQAVRQACDKLLDARNNDALGAARRWLMQKGITAHMINAYMLGTAKVKLGDKWALAVSIPIPNADKTAYWQKKRVAPWDEDIQKHPEYQAWKQFGVPQQTFFTHHPGATATHTWLCEGEWDAIRLGWEVKNSDLGASVAVACFTCGCSNVPPSGELSRLPGTVIIFYDRNDKPLPNGDLPGDVGAKKVATALGTRARIALVPMRADCTINGWDVSNALDARFTLTDFEQAASAAAKLPEPEPPPKPAKEPPELDLSALTKSRKGRLLETLRETYADRLKYNAMTKKVEMDGEEIEPDFIYFKLLESGLDVGSKEFAIDSFFYLAKQNQYHPVQDYLEGVYSTHSNAGQEILNTAAKRYLGTDDPLYQSMLKRTLIAAVARALNPGCKVDTALIFSGSQGARKSSFWESIAGDWFCDSLAATTGETDEKMKLYSGWIHEWAELEQIFKRKETSQVKAFLSARHDTFRAPWGRTAEKHARHSIIVGTTNEDDFLADPTGSRRYWIIPIKERINLELAQQERDLLWAAATHAYKHACETLKHNAFLAWILTPEEAKESERRNRYFQREDPWQDAIAEYVEFKTQVRVTDVLNEAIKLEISRQDRLAQMRVGDILKYLGWQKHHTNRGKVWRKGEEGSHVVTESLEQPNSGVIEGDYLDNLGSHKVVTVVTNNAVTTQGDHLNPVTTSNFEVVTAETRSSYGFEGDGDYLTTSEGNFDGFLNQCSTANINRLEWRNHVYRSGDKVIARMGATLQKLQWGTIQGKNSSSVFSPIMGGLHDGYRVKLVSGMSVPVAVCDLMPVDEFNRQMKGVEYASA